MPVEYRIDREHSLIRVEVSEGPDLLQITETVQRLLSDPEFRPGLQILVDHSKTNVPVTTEAVKATPMLFAQLGQRLGAFRCAVVVPDDAPYGMTRMTEALADSGPAEVRAFRSLEEAEAWLGEPPTAPAATDPR